MIQLPKPDVVFTHESDLDGMVSGLLLQKLASHLYGIAVPLQAFHNHEWRQRHHVENSAWVADMAFEAKMDRSKWLVVDHHPMEAQPKLAVLVHDLKRSASRLSYELCCAHGLRSDKLDRLVHLSDVGDLFLEDDPEFVLANDYASLVKTYQFWNLHALIQGDPERLVDHPLLEVIAMKRRVEDPIGYEWSRRNLVELSPTVGLVQTVVGNTNLIVHQLLERKSTPYSTLITLYRRGSGLMLVSLRSRDGSALATAERIQGGGHPNASGAVLPRSVRNHGDAIQYLRRILQPETTAPAGLNSLDRLLSEASLKPARG